MKNALRWEKVCGRVAAIAEVTTRAEALVCTIKHDPKDAQTLEEFATAQSERWSKIARQAKKIQGQQPAN